MILDANSLIDFHWLNEWDWLKDHYGLLCVSQEVFELNQITEATKESARQHLQLISLNSKEMYVTYGKFLQEFKPIATADCSTLAIAKNDIAVFSRVRGNKILERLTVKDSNTPHSCDYRYNLVCGTSDGKMLSICRNYGISHTCTLTLLEKMIETKHKSSSQVLEMSRILIEKRGKWFEPSLLGRWKQSINELS